MRYYRYGSDSRERDLETKEKRQQEVTGCYGELVIDEDTVYEIDEECMRCKEKK